MSKDINIKLTCDVCGKEEVFKRNFNDYPGLWEKAFVQVGYNESAAFAICGECRLSIYKDGFFKKIFNKVFKKKDTQ